MENNICWQRREFLRLGAQAVGAFGLSQTLHSTSIGAEIHAGAATAANQAGSCLALTADTPWIVAATDSEPLQRALEDAQRDWYKVFGHAPVMLSSMPSGWQGTAVYFRLPGSNLRDAVALARQYVGAGDLFIPG